MKEPRAALGLNILLVFLRVLPLRLVPWVSRSLGRLAPRLIKRDRELIDRNVRQVYGLHPHSSYARRFQQQVFQSQIAVGLETIKHLLWPDQHPLLIEGMDDLRAAVKPFVDAKQGIVIVTAHCGSWEFVAQSIAIATSQRFYALAKPSRSPAFTRLLGRMRSRMNTEVLWTDSKNLLREMIRVLKNGENLGFVMDQKPEGRVGPQVNFLGVPTEFVSGPAKLAIRHKSPVIAVFCMRQGPWRYRIHYQIVTGPQSLWEDETALTQAMAAAIESCIRIYPEQWLWNYKRWRIPRIEPGKTASAPTSLA